MGNNATMLKPQVLSDLRESTHFSVEEIRAYYKAFLDECDHSRMSVDVDRFKQLYVQVFPEGHPAKFAEQVFRTFDIDGNGRIDFREFILAVSIQQKGSETDKLQWLFHLFDLDGTGLINMAELTILVQDLRSLHGRRSGQGQTASAEEIAHHIMIKADKDRDQKLSLQEFVDAATSSATAQALLQGALAASSSPFTRRRTSKVAMSGQPVEHGVHKH